MSLVLDGKNPFKKLLVKFSWDGGNMGIVAGLFVATGDELLTAEGSFVELSTALGRRTSARGCLNLRT